MKKIYFILVLSVTTAQSLDSIDIALDQLRAAVETASRNGQRVLVDDFTALNCPYCGYASFAVSDMLDEFPETLISAQWHWIEFTPDDSDLDDCVVNGLIGGCFDARAGFYGFDTISAVPVEVFNGGELIIGADGQPGAYDNYLPIYQNLVGAETPYEIFINVLKDSLIVEYEVTVSLDDNMSNENQKVQILVVEDNIMSSWWIFTPVFHNARNVARLWVATEDLDIMDGGESQTFSGSFAIDGEAWNPDSVKIIAMVQSGDNSEIFQVQQINVNNLDSDQDGIMSDADNCVFIYNPGQDDIDSDDIGDACDSCDNANVWVFGNINGEVNTDQTVNVNIFDLLNLVDIIESNDQESCAYQISDFSGDGSVNLLDIYAFAFIIMEG